MERKPIIVGRKPILIPICKPSHRFHYGYIYISTDCEKCIGYVGKKELPYFDETYFGSGTRVKRAYNKRPQSFLVRPIDWADSKEELNQKEQYWIAYLDAVNSDRWYNILAGGDGGRLTGDSLERMKKSRVGKCTGKDNPNYGGLSEETKEKLRQANLGKKMSEETKKKIAKGNLGRKLSDEAKAKIASHHWGTTLSEETRKKISKNRTGKLTGKDHPNYGMHHTEENKRHLRELNLYGKSARAKKLYQYDLQGNLVHTYDSRSQIVENGFTRLDIPKVSTSCCFNDRSTDTTYVFREMYIFSSEQDYKIKDNLVFRKERT